MDNHGFKVPHTIPQDLLLIQELIGAPLPGPSSTLTNTVQNVVHAAAPLSPTTNQSPPAVDLAPVGLSGDVNEDISSSDEEGGEKQKKVNVQGDIERTAQEEKMMEVDVEKPSQEEKVVEKTKEVAEDEEDVASEEEIAADLINGAGSTGTDEDDLLVKAGSTEIRAEPASTSSDSSSESSSDSDSTSSGSDSDDDEPESKSKIKVSVNDADDLGLDEDDNPLPSTSGYYTTKHEVPETEAPITVPDVAEVGVEEILEKVGEVMNVVESTKSVIVRGLLTDDPTMTRASDKALDSDTLLVFEDRKVLGYIYETFGPTTQPFYLIKFSSSFPLDPVVVTVGRSVFNVRARSRFVFVSQIKAIKGSDASNVHDEEPADDELEFSDDEKEAEWRARLKRKRGENRARSSSVVSSRQSTPNPTHMCDQELASAERDEYISRNPYDEHGPYDVDYPSTSTSAVPRAGPSSLGGRMPVPYDDPYGEEYTAPDVVDREMGATPASGPGPSSSGTHSRGRGRGGGGRERDRGRGRGRDRERGRGGGGGRGARGGGRYGNDRQSAPSDASMDTYDSNGRAVSPTSMAIARATGTGTGYGFSGQSQAYGGHGYAAGGGFDGRGHGQEQYHPQQQQYYRQQQNQSPFQQPEIPGLGGYGGSSRGGGMSSPTWGYNQNQMLQNNWNMPSFAYQQQQGYGMAPAGVQPHINPRFSFGMGGAPPTTASPAPTWDGAWSIPDSSSSGQTGGSGAADAQYPQSQSQGQHNHSAWE